MAEGKIRKIHSDEFKAKVALAALKGDKAVNELSQEFCVASKQIYVWRDKLLSNAAAIFYDKREKEAKKDEVKKLQLLIGKLTVENDFLESVLNQSK